MKRFSYILALGFLVTITALAGGKPRKLAKKYPVIHFERTTINVGTFSQDDPVQKATFKFTNVGEGKLVINYVHTSCGCTAADYTKDIISPGGTGYIWVTYDGTGKMPGPFVKHIQVFTNCKQEETRIVLRGEMSSLPKEFNQKKK